MIFTVLTGGGSFNAGQTGNPLAREMQKLSDRRAMLPDVPDNIIVGDEGDLYRYAMSLPAGPLQDRVLEEVANEQSNPKYWYGQDTPRDPSLASSSSWVDDIQYNPRTRTLVTGGGRYSVGGVDPETAAAVLNGHYSTGNGSVGRSLINLWRLKGWGKNSGKGPLP